MNKNKLQDYNREYYNNNKHNEEFVLKRKKYRSKNKANKAAYDRLYRENKEIS